MQLPPEGLDEHEVSHNKSGNDDDILLKGEGEDEEEEADDDNVSVYKNSKIFKFPLVTTVVIIGFSLSIST